MPLMIEMNNNKKSEIIKYILKNLRGKAWITKCIKDRAQRATDQ